VTVEHTVYTNIEHMHVRATTFVLNGKVGEKTVPVIVASETGDPFTSKHDIILCDTSSNCQEYGTTAAERILECTYSFSVVIGYQNHAQSQYTFLNDRSSSI
jgi:hypothetical protein